MSTKTQTKTVNSAGLEPTKKQGKKRKQKTQLVKDETEAYQVDYSTLNYFLDKMPKKQVSLHETIDAATLDFISGLTPIEVSALEDELTECDQFLLAMEEFNAYHSNKQSL